MLSTATLACLPDCEAAEGESDDEDSKERAAVSVSVTWSVIRVPDVPWLWRLRELEAEPAEFGSGGSTINLADSTPRRARASPSRMVGMVLLMVFLACFARSPLAELIGTNSRPRAG